MPNQKRVKIAEAQLAAAARPEFKGNAVCVETRDCFRPMEESPSGAVFHWNENAETYFLIGDAMGKAMIKLIEKANAEK